MEKLRQLALNQIGKDIPTTQSLLRLSVTLAEAVNRIQGMNGRAKLDLVQKTLRDVLTTMRIPEDVKGPLRLVIDTVVPEALTLVIEAGRGQYDLKKPSVGCLARLCGVLCRRAGARVGGVAEVALNAVALKMESVAATVPAPVAAPPPLAPVENRPSGSVSVVEKL